MIYYRNSKEKNKIWTNYNCSDIIFVNLYIIRLAINDKYFISVIEKGVTKITKFTLGQWLITKKDNE